MTQVGIMVRDFIEMVRSGTGIHSDAVQDIEIVEYLNEAIMALLPYVNDYTELPLAVKRLDIAFSNDGIGIPGVLPGTSLNSIVRIERCLSPIPQKVAFRIYRGTTTPFAIQAVPPVSGLGTLTFEVVLLPFPILYDDSALGDVWAYDSNIAISPRYLPLVRWYVEERMKGASAGTVVQGLTALAGGK
jgi:hypothetical protein